MPWNGRTAVVLDSSDLLATGPADGILDLATA